MKISMQYSCGTKVCWKCKRARSLPPCASTGWEGIRVDTWGTPHVSLNGVVGGWNLTLWIWENSTAAITGSDIGSLDLGDHAAVSLSSSVLEGFIRFTFGQDCSLGLSGLKKGHVAEWSTAHDASGTAPFSLSIANCDVGGWGAIVWEPASVEVRDSELDGIIIGLHDSTGSISDISQAAHYDYWELKSSDFRGPTPSVRLVDVTILNWFGLMLGEHSSIQISNSNVDLTLVGRNLDVALSDSTIVWLGCHSASGLFKFSNCSIRNYVKFYDSSLQWSGSVTIPSNTIVGAWVNSTIRRVYDLQLSNRTGRPLRDIELRLENPIWPEEVLSSVITDGAGHASLTVPFTAGDWQRWFPVAAANGHVLGTLRFFGPTSVPLQEP